MDQQAIIQVPRHLCADQTLKPSKNDIIEINNAMKVILLKLENDHCFPLTIALKYVGQTGHYVDISTSNAEIIRQNFETAGYISQVRRIMTNLILVIDQPKLQNELKRAKFDTPPPYM